MLNFSSILLFSENPQKLADFYKKIFEKDPEWDMEGYVGFLAGTTAITIGPHEKVKGKSPNPERIILNFDTKDVAGEFDRIKALGATVIAEPYHPGGDEKVTIATLADPDGNYFQLTTPWNAK